MAIIDIGLCGTQRITTNRRISFVIDDYRKEILCGDENNGICYDGIVDEKSWRNTKYRLAFLLKETNGNDNKGKSPEKKEDWDYMEWVRRISTGEENIYPTFRNIAMWTAEFYDIFENGNTDKAKYIENGSIKITSELLGSLRKTAIVNLKKSWGTGISDWNVLDKHLENENICKLLRDEICMIHADVVICGSEQVYDFAASIWKGEKKEITTKGGNTLCYFKSDDTVFVKFYHPACRKKRESMFDYAKDAFETLKNNIA